MAHARQLKEQVTRLRRLGLSIPALSRVHGLAKSTVSLWVRDVELPEEVRVTMETRRVVGRRKGLAARLRRLEAMAGRRLRSAKADAALVKEAMTPESARMSAALLYWCEGYKGRMQKPAALRFANSDPALVVLFMRMLEFGFGVIRSRYRVLPHYHEYRDVIRLNAFWSRKLALPLTQFNRPYIKPNTAKRISPGYPGCVSPNLFDADLARTLIALYRALADVVGA